MLLIWENYEYYTFLWINTILEPNLISYYTLPSPSFLCLSLSVCLSLLLSPSLSPPSPPIFIVWWFKVFRDVLLSLSVTDRKPKLGTQGQMYRRHGLPAIPCHLQVHYHCTQRDFQPHWRLVYLSTCAVGCSCSSHETLNAFKHWAIFLLSQLAKF